MQCIEYRASKAEGSQDMAGVTNKNSLHSGTLGSTASYCLTLLTTHDLGHDFGLTRILNNFSLCSLNFLFEFSDIFYHFMAF